MDFEWIAIALGDVVWISLAFTLGYVAHSLRLPPLVGFLAAGFVLGAQGYASGQVLEKLSDLGITLLLFTVGLKLNVRTLARPQVWAVAGIHMAIVVSVLGVLFFILAAIGLPVVGGVNLPQALLIAFALSFSSTVFVVKSLEETGEIGSLHGRIAVGILIVQDLFAVIFIALATGGMPSFWALLILLLIPLRGLLIFVLQRVGHGELLVLYGFLLALGGAQLFELVGLKGDLGALIIGVLIAPHPKATELAKTMLTFKDLFLLGFFLSVGMSGDLSLEAVAVAAFILPLVLFKSALFLRLFTLFKLRIRTSLLATVNLSNFSEFGLIVAAIAVANGWMNSDWLVVIALSLAMSFVIAAILGERANEIYARYGDRLRQYQRAERIPDDRLIDLENSSIAVIGMGRVGTGAYEELRKLYGARVVGVDIDPVKVKKHQREGRKVLLGDPSGPDFWDRVRAADTLKLVMLALPNVNTTLMIVEQIRGVEFAEEVAATARYPDDVVALEKAGVSIVFNIYSEAGSGFAAHVIARAAADNKQD